ncbi:hypothetical protein MTR67_032183 [Solanum verrucosum]|uniref:RNase H type-1 domain-containing protein n=1 Tax=Solanum verrucosum TaxID=315347 RepID=A0AAF0U3T4_SOLVR|nr:hypothetical protein MTR67_032183 [Solanum verrucosum]
MVKSIRVSHAWKKMIQVRDEIEHDIWWQIKAGDVSFWFDNWTKLGALYYIEEKGEIDDEIEVRELIEQGSWNIQRLRSMLSEEMVQFIMESFVPMIIEGKKDKTWWMGSSSGNFTIPRNWEGMLGVMNEYKPKLHYHTVCWGLPQEGGVKCNTDGASKGNPGESAYRFCVRNQARNLMYAEACKIGIRTNMEAETMAILKSLRYCKIKKINKVLIETDSLGVIKMIRNEWTIPSNHAKEMEEIQEIIENIQVDTTHVFREANQLADKLVNEAYTHTGLKQWENFQQLSSECKSILKADKPGIPTLRIKTRKIRVQQNNHDNVQS